MEKSSRVDSEWLAINTVRETMKLATKGDMTKSTYNAALDFGAEIYPELLGREVSLIRRERESDTAKEYRQRAEFKAIKTSTQVSPLSLIESEIQEIKGLLSVAEKGGAARSRVDQLRRKLKLYLATKDELSLDIHSENQLIFRDAYNVDRFLPELGSGKAYKNFLLPDKNVLRIRVLHPDIPEHITGADVIYERHSAGKDEASVVAIQYKIWEERKLYLNDERMKAQLGRLKGFLCDKNLCCTSSGAAFYRFPHCSAFLRPTDRLQKLDQKLVSSGEHLPICQINACQTSSERGSNVLTYDSICETSLSSDVFEYLFNAGRIGSRMVPYSELIELYKSYEVEASEDRVIIHAQEF